MTTPPIDALADLLEGRRSTAATAEVRALARLARALGGERVAPPLRFRAALGDRLEQKFAAHPRDLWRLSEED